jgi:hypothetical protein
MKNVLMLLLGLLCLAGCFAALTAENANEFLFGSIAMNAAGGLFVAVARN